MPPVDPSAPVRLALIGAGVFARDAHVPSLLRHPDRFHIAAIYSRNLANAQALAQQIPYPVAASDDLAGLLAQPEIEAVAVLLPIPAMPTVIRQALAAGKHVLSEKPIAATLAEGQALLAYYEHQKRHPGQVWMVGENWRYEEAFQRAAALARSGALGEVLTCHWPIFTPINERSKYYHTTWRRDRSVPGGFVLDTGVHHVAV
ncbi:MAG TPA: Gfo/Idh/MocA family oxidoreductase, partial [Caldilineaceae bacterium]|nr:Gfo/Idh/MocA family oxidoreductase [Caldilineaceae bacterium]